MNKLTITQVHIDALHTLPPEQGIELINLLFAHLNGQNVNVDEITDIGVRAFFNALKTRTNRKGIGGAPKGNQNARKKQSKGSQF